jgi:hypothetical protein
LPENIREPRMLRNRRSLISLAADAGMRFIRIVDATQFGALAERRNLQPASCSFLQAFKCDHNCSKPRRTAMVTAWVRSLACSLSTRFLMWKLTVVSAIDS